MIAANTVERTHYAEIVDESHLVSDRLIYNAFISGSDRQKIDLNFTVEEGGSLKVVLFDLDRHDVDFTLKIIAGPRSHTEVFLAADSSQREKKRFDISVINDGREGESLVKMYGVASGTSEMTFLGSTKITNGSKRCRVRQEGRIINFDPGVKTQVSPQLLIDENDVEASHGAVLGAIPLQTLFYLMSHGVSKDAVKRLLAGGAFRPLVAELDSQAVRDLVLDSLESGGKYD